MTNTTNHTPSPIQTQNLESGDRITKNGNLDEVRTVSRIRRINHEKYRIDSTEGDVTVSFADDVWDLIEEKE